MLFYLNKPNYLYKFYFCFQINHFQWHWTGSASDRVLSIVSTVVYTGGHGGQVVNLHTILWQGTI
jgi:hypothetical protein